VFFVDLVIHIFIITIDIHSQVCNNENKQERSILKIGDSASLTKAFSDEDARSFAEISSDKNPVHLVDEFASGTQFERCLVHGMLTAGLISVVMGTALH